MSKSKKRTVFPDTEAGWQQRARHTLALAERPARALLEFKTPAGILADETDLDPFLKPVEKLAMCFTDTLDMEQSIIKALEADDSHHVRVDKLMGHYVDLSLASTFGAFALGVAMGRLQGGAR